MKPVIGVLAVALALAAATWRADAQGVGRATVGAGTELITHYLPTEGQPTQLTIIDPVNRSVAVYHVARDSGEIQLKSVRNIRGDLLIEDFNGVAPLPRDIMKQLNRRP